MTDNTLLYGAAGYGVDLGAPDLLADGLHPSERGYLQMAGRWFEALRPAIGP